MTSAVIAFLFLEEESSEKVKRKILRDCGDPLELPETAFIAYYRLNKEVLDTIEGHLTRSKVPPVLQLAASLRFLAEGSCQRSVGNDSSISVARSAVSTILDDVLKVMERFICPQWVKLEMDCIEKRISRDYFYLKYKIPSIIGCIDGTHIKIIKPSIDEHLFYNRK
ncbi:PREDICTED: uncharacterized protein LOC108359991 [Rhagoletis zephyria]|uniref:uncharacterized protein LOC108359991 n=1 Tax=Rhagoletis zephyria TaxID=28612 RepID=UPI000811A362|nr:PREDICTED: uncharacterized protein LOC108359991 [Rhagoletis zephyria]XP_036320369.1 uncharacterized protein LOC118734787 [Rhagoletis pomonella]